MLESMWNSLSSSMQLAEECLKQEVEQDPGTPLEGLELFAQTIDSSNVFLTYMIYLHNNIFIIIIIHLKIFLC
jgi:hypothetical protein